MLLPKSLCRASERLPFNPIHTDTSCLFYVFWSATRNLIRAVAWVNLCWMAYTKTKAAWLESSYLAASQLVLNHSLWSVLEPMPFAASWNQGGRCRSGEWSWLLWAQQSCLIRLGRCAILIWKQGSMEKTCIKKLGVCLWFCNVKSRWVWNYCQKWTCQSWMTLVPLSLQSLVSPLITVWPVLGGVYVYLNVIVAKWWYAYEERRPILKKKSIKAELFLHN